LGTGIALVSQRTRKKERRHVVPALICDGRIFAWPRRYRSRKAKRKSERQKPGLD
jgi:hypothetical protein